MGKRKKISADNRKEAKKTQYFAKLNDVPTSPRKMRLVADLIRGVDVNRALAILRLLRSAISNYEQKSQQKAEDGNLYVSAISVDAARMLKRLRPAPQGRGHRIRKRSNHVTLFVESRNVNNNNLENKQDGAEN